MASWSTNRKTLYLLIFAIVFVLAFGVPVFLTLHKSPTCSDGKMNGTERGIDCGGSCTRLCPADFTAPRVLWSHAVRVVPGVYNALAYVQNPNQIAEVLSVGYLFKLYDDKGILVAQKKGHAFVPAGQKFAVFEGGIQTGERIPVRTTFEFDSAFDWRPGKMLSKIRTLSVDLDQATTPKAEVKVKNDAVDQTFSNVNAFIILYDKNDNRIAFSKTTIARIGPDEATVLYFTWPGAFTSEIVRTEVLFTAVPNQ